MIVANKNKTGQLGPLLLARSRTGRGEPMWAPTVSLARVVVISDSIRFQRDQGVKGALY